MSWETCTPTSGGGPQANFDSGPFSGQVMDFSSLRVHSMTLFIIKSHMIEEWSSGAVM